MKKGILLFVVALFLSGVSFAADGWNAQTGATANVLRGVYISNEAIAVAVGDSGIDRTTNYGQTWTRVLDKSSSPGVNFYDVDFPTPSIGYAVGYTFGEAPQNFTAVYKTSNGGLTWSYVGTLASGTTIGYDISFVSATVGYMSTNTGAEKTTDGGATWSTINTGLDAAETYYGIFMQAGSVPGNDDTGFICGTNGKLYKTINSGSSWISKASGTNNNLNDIYFSGSSNGWAVGAAGVTTRTSDGGDTWGLVASGLAGALNSVHFIDTSTGYAVGASGKIVKSTNGGASWAEETSPTTDALHDVYFYDAGNGLAVGGNSCAIAAYTKDPTVTNCSPATGLQGQTYTLTLTTTNAQNPCTASFSGAGITVNSTTYVSPTQVTVNISISNTAAVGARDITLTNTPSGKSGTLVGGFTVQLCTPTVTAVSPSEVCRGTSSKNITITGSNFQSSCAATFSNAGITVNSTTYTSSTSATANIDVASGATLGAGNVIITNPNAEVGTGTNLLTINATPNIDTVYKSGTSTNASIRGVTTDLIISGSGFQSGATVSNVSGGTGITLNSTTVNSTTQITINVTIASAATLGYWSIGVTNPDGGTVTKTNAFQITEGISGSGITFNSKTSVYPGQTTDFTIAGSFYSGATLTAPTGITINSYTVGTTSITGNLTVGSTTTAGSYTFSMAHGDGSSTSVTGTVDKSLAITSVTPSTINLGTTTDLTISGTGFLAGIGVADIVFSAGTVNSITSINSNSIILSYTAPSSGSGAKNLTITNFNTEAKSLASAITINNPAVTPPSITSVSPTSGIQGNTLDVTISGSNFQAAGTVTFSNSGIIINRTTIASTSIVVNISIAAAATTGLTTVIVANPDGGSASYGNAFSVVASAGGTSPTITSIVDNYGIRNTSTTTGSSGLLFSPRAFTASSTLEESYMINGTGFASDVQISLTSSTPATTSIMSPPDVPIVKQSEVLSSTQIRIFFNQLNVPLGYYDVRVVNASTGLSGTLANAFRIINVDEAVPGGVAPVFVGPTPADPETDPPAVIQFEMVEAIDDVFIRIYDISGALVQRLGPISAHVGRNEGDWDYIRIGGVKVGNGIYRVIVASNSKTYAEGKLVIMRR